MSATDAVPTRMLALREAARDVAASVLEPNAARVDATATWPAEGMEALGGAGLLGLHVGTEVGGHAEGMVALALVTEQLGQACASTALVYGMHCVASKVVASKATPEQVEHYLAPIAAGEHVTSLALSEPGTGVHFYLPRSTFRQENGRFLINGRKLFVTSGGRAHSYVLSAVAEGFEMDPGSFSCILADADTPGMSWLPEWDGLGMRGNSSRGMALDDAVVPARNLLGSEGDQTWYVFEIIAPYFIVAMAGSYLGVAQRALDETVEHLRKRTYDHTGERVGAADVVAHRLGALWAEVERARQLLYHAARLGDAGDPRARQALFACKAEIAETAVTAANTAMTLTGGTSYARNGVLGRALRDARASHVMSPTTDLLRTWLGRSVLDLPLL